MNERDESIADVLVGACDTTIRTSFRMIKVPLVFYADLVERFAAAIEEALRQLEPEPDQKPQASGGAARPAATSAKRKPAARKKAGVR